MGVLTHYFKTKDDLVVFTFRWLADQSYAELDKLIATCAPGLPSLETAINAMFPKAREPAAIVRSEILFSPANTATTTAAGENT